MVRDDCRRRHPHPYSYRCCYGLLRLLPAETITGTDDVMADARDRLDATLVRAVHLEDARPAGDDGDGDGASSSVFIDVGSGRVRHRVTPAEGAGEAARTRDAAGAPHDDALELRFRSCQSGRRYLVSAGFNDAHIHLSAFADWHCAVHLERCETAAQVADTLQRQRLDALPALQDDGDGDEGGGDDAVEWVAAYGCALMEDAALLDALDRIAPRRPIIVWSNCLHTCAVNAAGRRRLLSSRAHAANGCDSGVRDLGDADAAAAVGAAAATATVFREADAFAVMRQVAVEHTPARVYRRRLLQAMRVLAAQGITSCQSIEFAETYTHFEALRDELGGVLPVRVYFSPVLADADFRASDGWYRRHRSGDGDGDGDGAFLRWGRVKMFADGSLTSVTAAVTEPYCCDASAPHICENYGCMVLSPEELATRVADASQRGWQCETHCIGDAAVESVICAYEQPQVVAHGRRHVATHVQHLSGGDDEEDECSQPRRMAAAGIVANIQPSHLATDKRAAERLLGERRCRRAYAWKSLEDAGVVCAGGSDAPVAYPSVLLGVRCAVERDGGWQPQQCVSESTAMRWYRQNAAYAEHAEAYKGVLQAGAFADIVVLSREAEAADDGGGDDGGDGYYSVAATVCGGRLTYLAPAET